MRLKVVLAVAAACAVVLLLYSSSDSRPTQRKELDAAAKGELPTGASARRPISATPISNGTAVATNQNSLLPPASLTWEKADDAPEFAMFAEWTHRFRDAATAQEQAALEPEGVALA